MVGSVLINNLCLQWIRHPEKLFTRLARRMSWQQPQRKSIVRSKQQLLFHRYRNSHKT